MLKFLFSSGDTLKFTSVSQMELQVLELIRINRDLAEKYFKIYKCIPIVT